VFADNSEAKTHTATNTILIEKGFTVYRYLLITILTAGPRPA